MVLGRPNLGRILIASGLITEGDLEAALRHKTEHGGRLGETLVALGLCTSVEIARALAEQLEIPFVNLEESPPSPGCLLLVPREVALEHSVLPLRMEDDRLLVAALDPFDIRVDEALRLVIDTPVTLAIAPEDQLREFLRQCYSENVFAESHPQPTEEPEDLGDSDAHRISVEKLTEAGEQISTVQIVNALIADAVRRGASDVHIEPESHRVRVRYRIDGRLRPVITLPRALLQNVVARVKIMCGMDISESRRPQDGGCRVRVEGREIEIRASTLRSVYGEIAVLRILNQDASLHRLELLGYDPEMLQDFRRLLAGRQGMILIAGPTGSGKTTTLYAALNYLNRDDINIMTVEDPVEIKLPGINQIQVHDRAGRTFATTLRGMLRQDPDIIMVGEIRDLETADIACRAALTGHLVLSTVHTQHALGTVARLIDMGVPPWMVTACLSGVVAQRLVRRVCDACGEEYAPPPGLLHALRSQFGDLEGATFRKGRGCAVCHRTGTRGRIGVYELLTIDVSMRRMLADASHPERTELREYVVKQGFRSMEEDAFRKACRGLIAPEEVVHLGFEVARTLEEGGICEDEPIAAEIPPAELAAVLRDGPEMSTPAPGDLPAELL